jgi:hypothetical protein
MKNSISFLPLHQQAGDVIPELLVQQIEEFCCTKDSDVEIFLKRDAIRYE